MISRLLASQALFAACAAIACSSEGTSSRNDDNSAGTGATAGELGGSSSGGSSSGSGPDAAAGPEDPPSHDDPFPPSDRTVRPSAACGSGSAMPPSRSLMLQTGEAQGRYYLVTPPGYDPSQPYPLGFVFHGANNDEFACRAGGNCPGVQPVLEGESGSVVVYMKSFGTSWTGPERDQNVAFFDDLLAHLKATYCLDERRVYALGTSSGAHFANILACRRGGDLMAIVPGAGERLETANCEGRVAALVLHGIDDTSVRLELGEAARDAYREQNGCSEETIPPLADVHAEVRAARDAAMTIERCADYQGCEPGLPVRWCLHSEPGYDGSTHGWPVAGGRLAWDFISEL